MLLLYPCLYAKLLYTHTHTKNKKYIYMLHLAGHVWLTFTVESLVQRTWLVIIKWITWYLVVAIRVHSNEQTHAHLSWNSLKLLQLTVDPHLSSLMELWATRTQLRGQRHTIIVMMGSPWRERWQQYAEQMGDGVFVQSADHLQVVC